MPMTSKDFQAIADAVSEAKRQVTHYITPVQGQDAALTALSMATRELATACAGQYRGGYSFKRQKFVEACGFEDA